MELTLIALNQIITMVILMAIGILCIRLRLLDDNTNKRISNLVLMLVNPLVIFLSYQREFHKELLHGLLISLVLAAISFTIIIFLSFILFRKDREGNCSVERFACIYSNCGFIGIPLANGMFGSEGVFYLTAYMTVFNLLVWTQGVMMLSGKCDRGFIKKSFLSPSVIATLSGFACFLLHLKLPEQLLQPMNILGSTNTPLAMIVAGVSIAQTNIIDVIKNLRILRVTLVKLLILPIILTGIFSFLPIQQNIVATSILATACPTAAMVIMFSYKYDKNVLYSSQMFTATTLFSMITIPIIMLFV